MVCLTLGTLLADYSLRTHEFQARVEQAVRARLAELSLRKDVFLYPETDKPNQPLKSRGHNTPYPEGKDDVSSEVGMGPWGDPGVASVAINPPDNADFKDPQWVCDDLVKTVVAQIHPRAFNVMYWGHYGELVQADYDDATKQTRISTKGGAFEHAGPPRR